MPKQSKCSPPIDNFRKNKELAFQRETDYSWARLIGF